MRQRGDAFWERYYTPSLIGSDDLDLFAWLRRMLVCDGTMCPCNLYPEFPGGEPPAGMTLDEIWHESRLLRAERELCEWWNPVAQWRTWRRQRRCMHGQAANWGTAGVDGTSYVVSLGLRDLGRIKLFECQIRAGGCGKRWT